ncbi:MAG TPA: ThuA domain-containing protein, partial [Phycisphaerae bacterium]|nr:ThuA domain-containing protein [Phycisphaerae bacterium]
LGKMKDPGKRPDKDYAVSWVRTYGKGRVFYTTLGHCEKTYLDPTFLRHVLAGVQFALGDLKADATPGAK